MEEQSNQTANQATRRIVERQRHRGDNAADQQRWQLQKTGKVYTDQEFEALLAVARPEDVPILRRKWKAYSLRREGRSYSKIAAMLGIHQRTAIFQVSTITSRLKTLERWHKLLNEIGIVMPPKKKSEEIPPDEQPSGAVIFARDLALDRITKNTARRADSISATPASE